MDLIKIEKLQAMRNYKKTQFLQNLFQYSLTAYVLSQCLSKGFPSLYSSLKLFFFVFLPKMGAIVVGPKCLFVVCILIVIILVGESNLKGCSSAAAAATDIYDEYMKLQTRGLRRLSTIAGKEREEKMELLPLIDEKVESIKEAVVQENEEEKEGREEEVELSADELNKRFEDFIARVNKQMRLEAQI